MDRLGFHMNIDPIGLGSSPFYLMICIHRRASQLITDIFALVLKRKTSSEKKLLILEWIFFSAFWAMMNIDGKFG